MTVQLPVTVGSTAANENLLSASSQVITGADWSVRFNQSNKLLIWRCGHKPVDGDLLEASSKEWNLRRGEEVFELPTYSQASVCHSSPIFIFFFKEQTQLKQIN